MIKGILIGIIIGGLTGIIGGIAIALSRIMELTNELDKANINNERLYQLYQELWSEQLKHQKGEDIEKIELPKRKPGRPRKEA